MKKRIALLIINCILTMAVCACAPKTAEQLLKSADSKYKSARSISLETDLSMKSNIIGLSQNAVSKTDLFLDPMKGRITTGIEGRKLEQYIVRDANGLTVYSNSDGKWVSYNVPGDEPSGNPMSLFNPLIGASDQYQNLADLGTVEIGGNKYRRIQADLNAEALKSAVKAFGLSQHLGGDLIVEDLIGESVPVIYMVDEARGTLDSITLELTDMINAAMTSIIPGGTGVVFEKLEMTTHVTEMNNVKPFNIPKEAYQAEPVNKPDAIVE